MIWSPEGPVRKATIHYVFLVSSFPPKNQRLPWFGWDVGTIQMFLLFHLNRNQALVRIWRWFTYIYVTRPILYDLKTKYLREVWPRSTSKRDQPGEVDSATDHPGWAIKEPINSSIPIWCSVPHIPNLLWLPHLLGVMIQSDFLPHLLLVKYCPNTWWSGIL